MEGSLQSMDAKISHQVIIHKFVVPLNYMGSSLQHVLGLTCAVVTLLNDTPDPIYGFVK